MQLTKIDPAFQTLWRDRGALAEIGRRAQAGEAVRIACYGDSTVLGADGVIVASNNWPARLGVILRAMTGKSDITIYNCGSGGKKIIDCWARDNYEPEVIGKYPQTEYVMINFGLNDVKTYEAPVWDADLYIARYIELLQQVRASGRTPIMLTPFMVSAAPIRPNKLIQGELMNAVREVAERHGVDLIDTNAMMQAWQRDRTDQYRMADVQADGTHGNDDVQIAVAQHVARAIFDHRVIDVSHGSRLGPHNASYSDDVTVAYNYNMSNAWGYSAQLTAAENVPIAAEIWVWSDRARRAVYVSPDRSVVSGADSAYVYVGPAGRADEPGAKVDFGLAVSPTDRPAENHLYVADLPFGLSRLRFRCGGAGVFEFGGWLIVDQFDPVSVSAYSVSPDRQLFLPGFADSRPEVMAFRTPIASLALDGDIPVGWGVVVGTQYVFQDGADTGPSRRKQSVVVQRTDSGADILLVRSGNSGVFAVQSVKTSGSGAWVPPISIHADVATETGNAVIHVRSAGQIIAQHNSGGTGDFVSPYGRLGGLYRDPAMVTDPVGRPAYATLIPMSI